MGPWSPEDIEGPFGVFKSRRNTGAQMARLEDEDPLISNDNGWILWLHERAIEMKGPLSAFQLKKSGFDVAALDYVRSADGSKFSDFLNQRKKVLALPYESAWIAHLAHQLSASVFLQNADALEFGRPAPLSSPFFYRQLTRRGRAHSKQRLEDLGVRYLEPEALNGPHASQGEVDGLSLDGETNVVSGANYVWMLSSKETEYLSPVAAKTLFPKGIMEPTWYWTRYRVRIEENVYTKTLPSHFTLLDDPHLPFGHDNLCVVQRTAKTEDFDIWIRLPLAQRFSAEYVKKYGDRVLWQLKNRLTGLQARLTDWPQEVLYSSSDLGPAIHPLYDMEARSKLKRASLKNVFFDGPEVAHSLSWSGQFRSNENTLKSVKERLHLLRVKKGESRSDISIHPT